MLQNILGIHYGHDATAVLIQNGAIVEAMSEERLSREKKHIGFPFLSVEYIKQKYGIQQFTDVYVVGEEFGGFAFLTTEDNKKFRQSPKGDWFGMALGARYPILGQVHRFRNIFRSLKNIINNEEKTKKFLEVQFPGACITYIHHHLAHAWAAVPFMDERKRHLIFTLDGQGDDASGSISIFENGDIQTVRRFKREHSLGLLYSSVVEMLGMTRNEHEFKVMGLAPYAKKSSGEKVYEKMKEVLWFNKESMALMSAWDTRTGLQHLLADNYFQHRFDSLAYGVQKLTEEVIKDMVREAARKYECNSIAIGGGVFMNVKVNQHLMSMEEVHSLTITPSCGDESLALGAAVFGFSSLNHKDLSGLKKLENLYLGSEYGDEDVKKAIDAYQFCKKCTVTYFDPTSSNPVEKEVAKLLSENKVVGRLKGRAEWGARALGNRSILANPSSRDNVKLINEMIKGRDFWMPFATSLKFERRHDYLIDIKDTYAPFMAVTFPTTALAEKDLIAALHPYDLTSRPQMVKKEVNKDYHSLISEFESLTGAGGILNTSFNLHGEPNVETPYDALRTFELSGLEYISIGNYLISKNNFT